MAWAGTGSSLSRKCSSNKLRMFTQSLSLCKDDTERDLNGKAGPAHLTLSNVTDKHSRAARIFDGTSTRSVRGSGGGGSEAPSNGGGASRRLCVCVPPHGRRHENRAPRRDASASLRPANAA